jgi:hypothetical protein
VPEWCEGMMAIFVMQTKGLRSNYIARRRDETESRPSWKSGLHRPYPEPRREPGNPTEEEA